MRISGGEEERVTEQENELLEAPFSEEEIRIAIFESYAEGVPGPDGFSFMFYHHFWDLIKEDFMKVVKDFEAGHLNLDRLNLCGDYVNSERTKG